MSQSREWCGWVLDLPQPLITASRLKKVRKKLLKKQHKNNKLTQRFKWFLAGLTMLITLMERFWPVNRYRVLCCEENYFPPKTRPFRTKYLFKINITPFLVTINFILFLLHFTEFLLILLFFNYYIRIWQAVRFMNKEIFGNLLCSNETQVWSIILVQLTNQFPQFSYSTTTYKQNLIKAFSGDYIFKRF